MHFQALHINSLSVTKENLSDMKKSILLFILLLGATRLCMAQSDIGNNITESIQKVKVFPNPATHVINILGLKNAQKASILISDGYGNTVLHHQWEIRNNALNIPIADLEKGFYMIAIQSQGQHVKTKFYKQ